MGGLRGCGRDQNSTFSEYGHVAYQIKADDAGSNMVANILPTDTPSTQGVGSKGQTIYFSESSHVAYQIEADDAGSNMVANILPTDTPLTQGMGQKVKLYLLLKVVMLHIKLKGIEHSTMKASMLSLRTPTTSGVGTKGHFLFFSKSGHVAYQSKVEEV